MAIARKILVGLAWLFVLGVVLQFFLAGLGTLGGQSMESHEAFGYAALHFFPVLIFIAALVARAPRSLLITSLALVLVTLVEPIWVTAFAGEFLGAMHVLGAAVILALAHAVAQRATRLLRADPSAGSRTPDRAG